MVGLVGFEGKSWGRRLLGVWASGVGLVCRCSYITTLVVLGMSLSLKHLTFFFRFSVRFFSLGGFLREFLHFEVHQDVAAVRSAGICSEFRNCVEFNCEWCWVVNWSLVSYADGFVYIRMPLKHIKLDCS